MNRKEFVARLENRPAGLALETGRCSTTPSAIQAWAAAEGAVLTSASAAVTNVNTGVLALDAMLIAFNNSPGTLSPADQAALDGIMAQSKALASQATAINTTPPGTPVPIVPLPVTPTP